MMESLSEVSPVYFSLAAGESRMFSLGAQQSAALDADADI